MTSKLVQLFILKLETYSSQTYLHDLLVCTLFGTQITVPGLKQHFCFYIVIPIMLEEHNINTIVCSSYI